MRGLTAALADWRTLLGNSQVLTDPEVLDAAQRATFATTARIGAILRPTRAQVPQALAVARRHGVPLQPLSTGKNWGYGSRVPPRDGCVVLDLGRLKAITGYDERRACVTVEPGVTQGEVYAFLQAKGGRLWLDATGAGPDCSVLGNTLERGFGHTPYGEHCNQVCGLEVLLGDGRQFRTGLGRFGEAVARDVYRWGLGPYLDGLFFQSNLAVVLEMTLWLMPAPEHTESFFFTLADGARLPELIDALRPLRLDGTLGSAVHIGNAYRMLAAVQQYPWAELGGKPVDAAAMAGFARRWRLGAWTVAGALYGRRAEVRLGKRALRAGLKGLPGRLRFVSDRRIGAGPARAPARGAGGEALAGAPHPRVGARLDAGRAVLPLPPRRLLAQAHAALAGLRPGSGRLRPHLVLLRGPHRRGACSGDGRHRHGSPARPRLRAGHDAHAGERAHPRQRGEHHLRPGRTGHRRARPRVPGHAVPPPHGPRFLPVPAGRAGDRSDAGR